MKQLVKHIYRPFINRAEYRKKYRNMVVNEQIDEKNDVIKDEPVAKNKNKKNKKEDMTEEQIVALESAAIDMQRHTKTVKRDRGLIERTESSKIVLTEDNRQVLTD